MVLDVDKEFDGDVPAALARAAALPASAWKVVQLGARTYSLNQSVRVASRTSVIGQGRGATTLVFSLGAANSRPAAWDAAITSDGPVPPVQCKGSQSSTKRPGQPDPAACAADWTLANFSLVLLR